MIYLASPYSDPDPEVMERRYKQALNSTARLFATGKCIFSPIVHCHPLAIAHELPRDFGFWQNHNFGMLRHAEQLLVLPLNGWKESRGVQGEIFMANSLNIEVNYLYEWLR